ncbi:MAG: hypothetical protein R6U54_02075 [Candidatus Omnitrophota bacterium]
MKIIKVCVLLFLLGFLNTVSAEEVPKDSWVDSVSTALPTAFCQSHQYFRQCFKISQVECEETATSATRVCINKFKDKIPNVLQQPEDGNYWGSIIGKCTGETLETTLIKKRISNPKCDNPDNWK